MAQKQLRKKRILSEREVGVCHRLREIRQRLNLSQTDVATQLRISRERLASYEEGRAPVRFEFALRFCYQLVVSEKWLALGQDEIIKRMEAPYKNGKVHPKLIWYSSSARRCMGLLFDPIFHRIKPETLFFEAYDKYLDEVYERLFLENYHPRILVSEALNDALIRNYIHALLEIWLQFKNCASQKMRFLRLLAEAGRQIDLCFPIGGLSELERDEIITKGFESGAISDSPIPDQAELERFIAAEMPTYLAKFNFPDAGGGDPLKKDLTADSLKGKTNDVKSELEKLIARVKRVAAHPGVKAELARFLDVAPARVTEWLNDDPEMRKEPGGHYTLELLKWVEQQERQK